MNRLIGIIRDNGALTARLVQQNIHPDFEAREAVQQAAELPVWHEVVEQPLESLEAGLCPNKEALLTAWETLGQVRDLTPEVILALRQVLAGSVLGPPAPSAAPPSMPADTGKTMPTAAHPRAYQGTKHKPPKEKASALTDLRPTLCGTGRLGLLPENEEARLAAEARLPQSFRLSLYPLLRRLPDSKVGEYLTCYWALGLDSDPARLAAVAYLFSLQKDTDAGEWCRFVAVLPEEQRTPLLHLLIASGAYAVRIQDLPPSFAAQVGEVLTGADPLYRAYWLLHGLTTGIAPDYLLTGFRLADAYARDGHHLFHEVKQSGYFPAAVMAVLWERLTDVDDFYPGFALTLWEQCGLRPGLGGILDAINWMRLTPEAAYRCIRLYATSWDNWGELSEEQADKKWRAVRSEAAAFEALLQSCPLEFQEKCVRHLIEYLWQWDTPAELNANLPAAVTLTRRLCRPPFAERSDPCEVTTDFLAELSPSLRERFLKAPDTSFRRLEEACRRENDTWLIGRGAWALTRQAGEFAVRCFEDRPARLFKVAKLLGSLSGPMREDTVRAFAATVTEPDVFKGLEWLEQEALRVLAQGLSGAAQTSADKHALQMQRLVTDNRRALRKFLDAHWSGRKDYLRDHVLTRRWLDAHPRLDLDAWLGGVPCEGIIEDWGQVTLAIEADPLEALKLGTYVGSCLGLGGSFTYSAAAAVLDINKQVVYARNTRGAVVGRQLVAVSEDDRLVCFEVYPLSARSRLGRLFADFDTRLAQRLGLPLHDPHGEAEYEIACILSHDWWDDMAWDLTAEEDHAAQVKTPPTASAEAN